MADKKPSEAEEPKRRNLRKGINLSMNQTIAERGFAVARELGFGASEIVEKFLELLHEERRRIPKRKRGDHLQITLFDRITEPEQKKKK